MKRFSLSLSSFLLVGMLYFLFFPLDASANVVINEFFSSTSNDDWVEIYNTGDDPVDVSIYRLRDSSASNKIDLTGILEAKNFKSFNFGNSLNNSGDVIKLVKIADESIVDQVGYGDEGQDVIAPLGNFSAGRIPNGSGGWNILETATPGQANTGTIITPTNTPTPTPTNTPTPTKTPTPTSTPKPTATTTPTPTIKIQATSTLAPTRKQAVYPTTKSNVGKLSTTTGSPMPTAILGNSTAKNTPEPTLPVSPTKAVKVAETSQSPLQTVFLGGMGVLAVVTVGLGGYIYKQSKNQL